MEAKAILKYAVIVLAFVFSWVVVFSFSGIFNLFFMMVFSPFGSLHFIDEEWFGGIKGLYAVFIGIFALLSYFNLKDRKWLLAYVLSCLLVLYVGMLMTYEVIIYAT